MLRILQISDTHLAHDNAVFEANFDAAKAMAATLSVDLVINTGDLSLDGSEREEDLEHAAARHREISLETLIIPGNHDVGETFGLGDPAQAISAARLERYRHYFGPDWWVRDIGTWRLIGLNSMLLGSGLPDERVQVEAVAEAISQHGSRSVAVFMHKPLYLQQVDEASQGYFTVPPDFRGGLGPIIDHPAVRLVSTGHLHQCAVHIRGPRTHVWAPSTAFVAGPMRRQQLGGEHEIGVVLHELGNGIVKSQIVTPSTMTRLVSEDLLEGRAYPHFRKYGS